MAHPFKHFHTVNKHRFLVFVNGCHCGIGFHCLFHDLSKYGPKEFSISSKYYSGTYSPVLEERRNNDFFSEICQHHTRHNKHHWEYWTDFFKGNIIKKTMPWIYATEYVCDMLSASYVYDPKAFSGEVVLRYFEGRCQYFHMTACTREYIRWCLSRYARYGFRGLKKKDTKAKYRELKSRYPEVEALPIPGAGELSI